MGSAPADLRTVGVGAVYDIKELNFKERQTEIEDISKDKRNMKMTHVALDAVYTASPKRSEKSLLRHQDRAALR
jgi:hypothetical protein